ncbi:hypothetical protein [Citrobacter werkmanii]|uniref:hypothetical protein n=1 Tax=Citrobacter werkmanii TaxID=67827 RepID=UPI0026547950|nr:hypothetical protein [Citrobacter werkmanii]MDN8559092.1 hypothetical protein [Citrobacter werkmanii]
MKKLPYQQEIKAIRLLQERGEGISRAHTAIGGELDDIRQQLAQLGSDEIIESPEFVEAKARHQDILVSETHALSFTPLSEIYQQADSRFKGEARINDILSPEDMQATDERLAGHIADFNRQYSLDAWDYAIAGCGGLFAAMLDILFVKAPPKPTTAWTQQVDGVFNRQVQNAFNKIIPPELSDVLCKKFPIGAPDSSVTTQLLGASGAILNPVNHRLKALSHDPLLSFIFGVRDMMDNTCTVVHDGIITRYPSSKTSPGGNVFQLLGRMFGHLLSDVNAPSAKGNRGMGLPAPFMGLLRMLEGIPVGESNFGKQIEFMYVSGYDFRQFIVTSIPVAMMEVLMRVFYIAKQMFVHNVSFTDALMDTLPLKMNPRFRMMLALAYGTSSAVNAGKMYITGNILNANYASWMGLAWNGFHAMKWALLDRHLMLWKGIEETEIKQLEVLGTDIDRLALRTAQLPV